ncbi:MAG: nitroreductase family protein [Helicobacteraceae bacterium]|jgi:nitroreductase|nr:nitroreductase family protein [Helicobacteraceae bacterium]
MDFSDFTRFRQAHKSFGDKKIDKDDFSKILEAGRLSPSSYGSEPWKFIAITNAQAEKLRAERQSAAQLEQL